MEMCKKKERKKCIKITCGAEKPRDISKRRKHYKN